MVKRYYSKRHNLQLNTKKAHEITSAFTQGREYFNSFKLADLSVQPLLLYYGIISLSRGLILTLNPKERENSVAHAHGLSINNWNEVAKSKQFENLKLKTSRGTFTELIIATGNKTYIRNKSSGINYYISYDIPPNEIEISLLDIAHSLPDLAQTSKSWLNKELPIKPIEGWVESEKNKYVTLIQGQHDEEYCKTIFPAGIFNDLEIEDKGNFSLIRHSQNNLPRIVQKWVGAFRVIGVPFVTPPIQGKYFINDISMLFAGSYTFGMISRYYPSVWNNINKGIQNDSINPFTINLMSFLEETYPKIILDFLKSPYNFEKENK